MAELNDDEIRERHLDVLSIFLKAFPEDYSDILWEELRFQLNNVLHHTIISILRIICLGDLQDYLDKHPQ